MANSVTARFNDDCKVFVSMSDDTTVEKAVIIDAEGNETDIAGGGGESDFSTATVTYTTNQMTPLFLNHIDDNINGINPTMRSDGEYSVILYKQKAIGVWISGFEGLTVETTGNITVDSDQGIFTITGDGTISIL